MKRYAFYSHLPPEEFLRELYERTQEETTELEWWHGEAADAGQWKAEWKCERRGDRFELYCTRSEKGKTGWGAYSERSASGGKGRFSLGTSFGYGKRIFWNKQWGDRFQGRVNPCPGGSVLYGRFRALRNSLWLLMSLLVLLICVVCNRDDGFQVGLGVVLGAAMLIRYFTGLRNMEERPLNRETLEFLKHYSDHWEVATFRR